MALLTDAKARNIRPDTPPLPHGGVTGLTLHPASTGKGRGKWVLRYVSPTTKKRRNAGLGAYPEIGVAEASRQAQLMREQLAKGIDPLELRAEEEAKPRIPSLKEAANALHCELRPGWKNAKHAQQWINTLKEYAFPLIGGMSLDQIQPRHIADALRPIWLGKPETAGRVKQRLHAVMAWGWAHGYCMANPVDVVGHLLPQQPGKSLRTQHQPAMPWQDIPAFITKHLNCHQRRDATRAALVFLLLTAARSGEVRGATWEELDLDAAVWTIPAGRMKAKQAHRVPLSEQALEVIRAQRGLHELLVFPSVRDQTALSDMALTSFLRRMKAASDVQGRAATAHGFRSSFRDWCSEKGYSRDLAEKALAHAIKNKVEAAYHRTDLLEQRRPMMQAWADYLMA
jgi:integrase